MIRFDIFTLLKNGYCLPEILNLVVDRIFGFGEDSNTFVTLCFDVITPRPRKRRKMGG